MGLEENIVIVPGKLRAGSHAGGIQEGLTLDLLMEGKQNTGKTGRRRETQRLQRIKRTTGLQPQQGRAC